MIPKVKKDKRFRYSIVVVIFLVASVFQVILPNPTSAAASKVEGFSLENQIKTYKLYYSIAKCFDINQNRSLTASQAASWQWFAPSGNATNSGSIVAGGDGNGDVNCNDQIKIAAAVWGITDQVAFLKKAGWKATTTSDYDKCKQLNPIDEFGSCNSASTTKKTVLTAPAKNWGAGFQTAARAQLNGYGATYRSYFTYQDAMDTLLGTCGGTIVNGDPNETQQAAGAKTVYIVEKDGKITKDFVDTSELKGTVKYGAASGVFGISASNYDGKNTNCTDIVKYLGVKANATEFYSNLPVNAKDAYTAPTAITEGSNKNSNSADNKSDCDPSMGLGWLLCPAVKFLAGIGDQAKDFIDDALTVNTSQMFAVSTQGGGNTSAYTTWQNMRNIANVIFIIAFLFMIYSQLTGFGLTNYALKKMLPRLVVAAILINASFYITVAGVELSNVVGQGIDSLLSSASGCSSNSANDTCISVSGIGDLTHDSPATSLGQIAGTALTLGLAAAGVYFFLPTVIAVVVYVAFVAMAAAILLGIRQALIILLVIASPIAFAAYLLPNTESIFKKWWGLFKAMLFIFPIFALLYGAGKLAAAVLQSIDNPTMQVFGCVALFAGLLALPKMLEGALNIGGIASIVGRFQNKATDATNKKIQNSNVMAARQARMDQRRVNRKTGNGVLARWGKNRGGKIGAAAAWVGTTSSRVSGTKFGRYTGMDRGTASAVAEQQRLNNEAVERSMTILENGNPDETVRNADAQLRAALASGDVIGARAATRVLAKRTGSAGVQRLNDIVRELDTGGGLGAADGAVRNEVNAAGLKGVDRALDEWSRNALATRDASGKIIGQTPGLDAYNQSERTAAGLNEAELAGQSVNQLQSLNISGDQARRVLAAHERGSIHLDDKKLARFTELAATNGTYSDGGTQAPNPAPRKVGPMGSETINQQPAAPASSAQQASESSSYLDVRGRSTPSTTQGDGDDYHDAMTK